MAIDSFFEAAWAEHGEHAQDVAKRLAESTSLVTSVDQVAPYAALVAHVFGEHLGAWDEGLALLARLRAAPSGAGDAQAQALLERHAATLRYAAGDIGALQALAPAEHLTALAAAAAMLGGRGEWPRAIAAFDAAMRRCAGGVAADSKANRALAVMGNNLAAALEEMADRSPEQTRAMLAAADTGLTYWRVAGTWLEEERAQYRLARCRLQAGDAAGALRSARQCIAVCESNSASAFERFFGYAVLAIALRAAGDAVAFNAARDRARELYAQVEPGERRWCETDLEAIATSEP
jgi:tetratricopeptide (TPR) repeat protein